ncbi:MAG TPA: glycosyltransferase [Candidatus Polarisedimenticolaceae bacterium]|nr:glycosyltransferase [Candidatus Polarisedimenticolaceae bacterium]
MRRLLLIAYYFPPIAGSGTFRPLRISRYLPAHGWAVSVLSVNTTVRLVKDPALADEVRPDTTVVRTATLEPRNLELALRRIGMGRLAGRLESWLLLPDEQRGWVPFAVAAGRRLLRGEPHHALLSTSSPYSTHLVGRALAASGLPWIADFRDEWTTNPYLIERYPTAWHAGHNRRLECRVLRAADAVVSVSAPWAANHRSLVPDEPAEKFHVLPNGYDPQQFAGRPWSRPDRFRVLYTGTFYGIRRPEALIDGVGTAIERGLVPADRLELVLMGQGNTGIDPRALPPGVLTTIEHRPQREAIDEMYRAAVLVLVVPRAGGEGNHTGKLFNYLAVGAPILALAPEPNVAADLVRDCAGGIVVPPDDPAAVADGLGHLFRMWSGEEPTPPRRVERIAEYAADRQAGRLAALLDRLVDRRARG